ncbi:MAG: mechanosensitive ion channel family protein, partial [Alphaproteobacteria bacterium]|nr:mechanosensitive ion channel family protein [Alphaproteobacteria bacterium]
MLATLYVVVVGLVWLFGVLTSGSRNVEAAVSSILVIAVVPVINRLGRGLLRTALTPRSPAAGDAEAPAVGMASEESPTFADVAVPAFQIITWAAGTVVILDLWGLDLVALVRGSEASAGGRAVFDIALTMFVGLVLWETFKVWLARLMHGPAHASADRGAGARARTLVPLLRKAVLVAMVVVVAMIVLSSLGVDIGPLLASAGVVGIAIGFGAQTLVRDVVSGVFFLVDDAFRVGEYVEIGELRGTVEAMSIRSLQLRHHRGAVHTIPFGEMRSLTNYSRDWVIEKLELGLQYDTDLDKVKAILKQIGKDMMKDPEVSRVLLEPLKSQGVSRLGDFAIIVRAKFKSLPGEQFIVRREAYKRIKRAFEENG